MTGIFDFSWFYILLLNCSDFFYNNIFTFLQAKKKAQDDDWDNWFSEQDKELQQIFQGQSAMREVLTDLHRKMDEIITRQERTLVLVQQVNYKNGDMIFFV